MERKINRHHIHIMAWLTLVCLACMTGAAAELPFGSQTDILTSANGVNGAVDLVAGDFNSDGNLDLIMCSEDSGQLWIVWAYAGGGTSGMTVATGLDSPRSADVGDIDQDGDLDIIIGQYNVTYPGEATVMWFENPWVGANTTWTQHDISIYTYVGIRSIKLADLDGDGDLDYVAVGEGTYPIVDWKENDLADSGTMGWGDGHTMSSGVDKPWDVEIADLDLDGDLDVVVPDVDLDTIFYFESDGTPANGGWTDHTLTTSLNGANSVSIGDVDNDGMPDVVASGSIEDQVVWYENGSWTEHNVVVGINGPASVEVADMDVDGDLDIVTSREGDGEVLWIENTDGAGTIWLRHSIDATFAGAVDVLPVDIDGDGDLDVAAVGFSGDRLSWWENENTHRRFAEADPVTIRDSLANPRGIATADVNQDGIMDVVVGGWDNAWVKLYLGVDGSLWWENVVDTGTNGFRDVAVADINRDGRPDILGVTVSGDAIYWWANDGSALPNWTEHTVLSSFNGAHAVEPVDLDADGDLDLVVAAFDGDEATIIINDDGVGGSWTKENFTPFDGAYGVAVGDLNEDGRMDFVASGYYEDAIRIFLQGPSLWSFSDISGLDGPRGIALGDIDGDSDLDIIGAIRDDDDIKWFENDGAGGTWTVHNVGSGYLSDGSEVQAVDIDHDGDIDILGTGYLGDDVYLWRNGGDGSSWSRHTIESGLDSPWQALAVDIDGDDDLDVVLAAAGTTDSVTWYENFGNQFAAFAYNYAPAAIDDGEKDVIFNFLISDNGRSGVDNSLEMSRLQLYFEDTAGTPLTSTEINNIVDRMEIYLDLDDDLMWTEGVDTLIVTDTYLSLSSGTLTYAINHGLAGNEVTPGHTEGFFVVLQAASDASQQSLRDIVVTMKTDQLESRDRSHQTPLIGEPAVDKTTGTVSFGMSIFSDGFESGNTLAWDVTVG